MSESIKKIVACITFGNQRNTISEDLIRTYTMKSFETELIHSIRKNIGNNYGRENYSEERYGNYSEANKTVSNKVKNLIKSYVYKTFNYRSKQIDSFIENQKHFFQYLWENLNEKDKALLVELTAYRLLGYEKVKLSVNDKFYQESLVLCSSLGDPNDTIDPHCLHFLLNKMNLKSIGFDLTLYNLPIGILTIFILEQYAYKLDDKVIVGVEKDDIVLDCGGCWGDTALYFADRVGKNGKVYSFEFIPNNIDIFKENIKLNPGFDEIIEIVPYPVSDKSDTPIFFKDNGPGSTVSLESFKEQTGTSKTIAIDDLISKNSILKVDFIKMDIEGAELSALKGAENVIRKFKPKLAISIYHSLEDFYDLPKWILDLDLGYELYLGHYTIHSEETVLFAKAKP